MNKVENLGSFLPGLFAWLRLPNTGMVTLTMNRYELTLIQNRNGGVRMRVKGDGKYHEAVDSQTLDEFVTNWGNLP